MLDAAFDLIADAFRIHRLTWVDNAPDPDEPNGTGKRDLDLGDLGDVGAVIDGAGEAFPAPSARAFRPRTAISDAFEDAAESRVFDVVETEGERILPRRDSQLIDERFDREHVLGCGQRAEVRGAKPCRLDVQPHRHGEAGIGRDRVPAGGHPEDLRVEPSRGVDVGVLLVLPRRNAARGVEPR